MRRFDRALPLFLAAGIASTVGTAGLGCRPAGLGTEVLVVVDAEPGVLAVLDVLEVRVPSVGPDGLPLAEATRYSASCLLWPLTVALAPFDLSPERGFDVEARALDPSGATIARVRATGPYDVGRRVGVQLTLFESCADKTCPSIDTCSASGCTSAEVMTASLPDFKDPPPAILNCGQPVAPGCEAIQELGASISVDASAPVGGLGTASCPFKTITQALDAARRAHFQNPTIHAAAGTYDAALGETFPLVLRGETLVGTSSGATVIHGSGPFDRTMSAGSGFFGYVYDATLVIGDPTARTHIEGVGLEAGAPGSNMSVAVICDQGNALRPPAAQPTPNSELVQVAISGGYTGGALVTGIGQPAQPTACNLAITGSRLSGMRSFGVWVSGTCGPTADPINAAALVFGGDTPGSGNTMEGFVGQPNACGAILSYGIDVWDCTALASIHGNTFAGMDYAIAIAQHADPLGFRYGRYSVVGNQFSALTVAGVALEHVVTLDELTKNRFERVRDGMGGASAVRLESGVENLSEAEPENRFPSIGRARNNVFLGNDTAVDYRYGIDCSGNPVGIDLDRSEDWGTPSDPGNNVFACTGRGHAFLIEHPAAAGSTIAVSLAGNSWDHAPPLIGSDPSQPAEIVRFDSTPPIDVSNASLYSGACP
jgi:hypothetical protein